MQGSARLVPGTIVDRRDHDVMRRALGLWPRAPPANARLVEVGAGAMRSAALIVNCDAARVQIASAGEGARHCEQEKRRCDARSDVGRQAARRCADDGVPAM